MILRPSRNYIAYSRIKMQINRRWDFIPGITWLNNRNANTFEVNAGVRYENNIRVSLAYRNPMDLGVAVGMTMYAGFRLAYSYDYGLDTLRKYNSGTHEVTISYTIPVNNTYVRNKLRFFRWKLF